MSKANPCIWCDRTYQIHAPSFDCYNGRKYGEQGSIALSYFPIGTQIGLYTSPDGHIIQNPGDTSIHWTKATLLALANPLFSDPTMLLGWPSTSVVPPDAWEANDSPPEYAKLMKRGYEYGLWVLPHTPVKVVLVMPVSGDTMRLQTHSGGMACSRPDCRTFNDYAEPNQPDGKSYICFSCRQRGY